MLQKNGALTLNGMTDGDLVKILQIKEKHEDALQFNPQGMQPAFEPRQPPAPNNPQRQVGYNNVILAWSSEKGLEAVLEILQELAGRHRG